MSHNWIKVEIRMRSFGGGSLLPLMLMILCAVIIENSNSSKSPPLTQPQRQSSKSPPTFSTSSQPQPQPEPEPQPQPQPKSQTPSYSNDRVGAGSDVEKPKCDGNVEFCEHAAHYPTDLIRRVLRSNNSYPDFFKRGKPELDSSSMMMYMDPSLSRGGGDDDDYWLGERVCDIQEQVIRPKVGTNKEGQQKFIVNDGEKYQQFVKIEKCKNANEGCKKIDYHLPLGRTSKCQQKLMWHLLVAFEQDTKKITFEEFFFPVACVCYVQDLNLDYTAFNNW